MVLLILFCFVWCSLGPLVCKVKEYQVEWIVDTLCTNMAADKEQLRDISSIGKHTKYWQNVTKLRQNVLECPRQALHRLAPFSCLRILVKTFSTLSWILIIYNLKNSCQVNVCKVCIYHLYETFAVSFHHTSLPLAMVFEPHDPPLIMIMATHLWWWSWHINSFIW